MSSFPPTPPAALPRMFYTLREFAEMGGPSRGRAYVLAQRGLLDLVALPGRGTGVTAEEAARYFASGQPLGVAKRNLSAATAASLRGRGKAA